MDEIDEDEAPEEPTTVDEPMTEEEAPEEPVTEEPVTVDEPETQVETPEEPATEEQKPSGWRDGKPDWAHNLDNQ